MSKKNAETGWSKFMNMGNGWIPLITFMVGIFLLVSLVKFIADGGAHASCGSQTYTAQYCE